MMRRLALVAGVVLLTGCTVGPSPDPGIIVSGAVPPASISAPSLPPTVVPDPGGPGQQAEELVWTDCDVENGPGAGLVQECSWAEFPLSASDPGLTTRLSLMRLRSENTPDDAPALVVQLGEPGEFSTSAAREIVGQLSPKLLEQRQIVVMDIRGTGASDGLDCVNTVLARELLGLPGDPRTHQGGAIIDETARQLSFDCADVADPFLTRYNTVAATNDLDSLRASLGTPTLDFLGRGFGATLGAVYAERYPSRVGAMVLDAPQDPRLTDLERVTSSAAAFETLLDRFAQTCVADSCELGADPRQAVLDLVDQWDTQPLRHDGALLTGGSVLELLRLRLDRPDNWTELATALATADVDPSALTALLLAAAGEPEQLSADQVLRCNDATLRLSGETLVQAAEDSAAAAPLFGPYLVGRLGLCGGWPAPTEVPTGVTANGAAPIVVVGATDDPLAPMSGISSLTGQMASAVTITRRSSVHPSYGDSPCVTDAVDQLFVDGTVPTSGLLCPP